LTLSVESVDETSKTNREEAFFTLNLIKMLASHTDDVTNLKGRIGVITPYKA
jgi:hypothetical protein